MHQIFGRNKHYPKIHFPIIFVGEYQQNLHPFDSHSTLRHHWLELCDWNNLIFSFIYQLIRSMVHWLCFGRAHRYWLCLGNDYRWLICSRWFNLYFRINSGEKIISVMRRVLVIVWLFQSFYSFKYRSLVVCRVSYIVVTNKCWRPVIQCVIIMGSSTLISIKGILFFSYSSHVRSDHLLLFCLCFKLL